MNCVGDPIPPLQTLVRCGSHIQSELQLSHPLELSMGMSADYEHAVSCYHGYHMLINKISTDFQIELGSTNVRIGTALFGERPD